MWHQSPVAKSAVTGAPVTGGRDATCKAMAMKIEGTGFHLEDHPRTDVSG